MANIIVCSQCGRERPHAAHGLCNVCHVKEYKKKKGYKGKVGICQLCGQALLIKARHLCSSCYNFWYSIYKAEDIKKRLQEDRNKNPEKYQNWGKAYRERNRDKIIQRQREYWRINKKRLTERRRQFNWTNKERLTEARRRKIWANSPPNPKISVDPSEKIENLLINIPELKRIWVREFLNGAYKDRNSKTQIKFLQDMVRLTCFLERYSPNAAQGGWNTLTLVDIEKCQVETGILKDSLRIFFKWLLTRKNVNVDLAKAIPTQTMRRKKALVPIKKLEELFDRWIDGKGELTERIAGLLIIYYGFTVEELRFLRCGQVDDGVIHLKDENIVLDELLKKYVNEYSGWKHDRYFGTKHEYFFINQESISRGIPVGPRYFADLFKRNNVGLKPSELRKAMIWFHKEYRNADPFHLAAVFRISARAAALYDN